MIVTGLDRLLSDPSRLIGRRYGVLSHAAAATSSPPRSIVDALAASAAGPPRRLFSPEHGFWAVEQDMIPSEHERDPFSGVETISLYGSSEESLQPPPGSFEGLDLLLVDLQDIGNRVYTYAATAVWTAEKAIAAGVEVWVLDRPNPLGGELVEGNLRRTGFESFVSAFHLPMRHHLTLGELVRLEAKRRRWDDQAFSVIELDGWRRESPAPGGPGWRWRTPSPNMPTMDTAIVFCGSVLIEATELSEARGTTRPFELIGAPGLPAVELARRMSSRGISGVVYLPVRFRPQFQKHARKVCDGVEIVVTDAAVFPSYRAGIELLRAIHEIAPQALEWRKAPYEFVSDRPAIDLLTGGNEFRTRLESGGDVDGWISTWRADEEAFLAESGAVLLYPGDVRATTADVMGERRSLTHALRVTEGSAAFRSLYAAIDRDGERAGWLELSDLVPAPASAPEAAREGELGGALGDGVWKAVGVESGRSLAIKRRRGAPVLRDLMREHFSGCRVVLVRGEVALPLLRSRGEDWEIELTGGETRRLTTAELVRALRSPHFA